MNKQDLIEKIKDLKHHVQNKSWIDRELVLDLVEQLDEPQKPIVPQVVMDYYEFYRGKLTAFEEWFAKFEVESDEDFQRMDEVGKWLYDVGDFKTQTQRELALAMLIVNGSDAVEVEKEKRYYVRFKGMESDDFNYLNFIKFQRAWVLSSIKLDKKFRTEHTKKELEQAGFGWVFDCPGIEIEEVKDDSKI